MLGSLASTRPAELRFNPRQQAFSGNWRRQVVMDAKVLDDGKQLGMTLINNQMAGSPVLASAS
ncbi:MAG: hypothetical protein HC889_03140 [Synechococcaceae cyanobacterium SM1_2_3]|nr:hypothetical protein [Synechococcaceae cyanobacterium SM1_2_3]